MPRVIKFFLFLFLFITFFEVGVISSYTLVTSQPPEVGKLINTQIEALSSYIKIGKSVISHKAEIVNVTNKMEVAQALQRQVDINGVDLNSFNATTFDDLKKSTVNINITVTAYKENTTETTGEIVITPIARFKILATAKAKPTEKGVEVNVNTIKIISILRIY